MTTNHGISRDDGYKFTSFTTNNGLSDNEVLTLFKDSQNRIWFLTFNGFPTYWQEGKFHNIENTAFLKEFVFDNIIFRIVERNNGSIIGTSISGKIKEITKDSEVISFENEIKYIQGLISNNQNEYIKVKSEIYKINSSISTFDKIGQTKAYEHIIAAHNGDILLGADEYSVFTFQIGSNKYPSRLNFDFGRVYRIIKDGPTQYWVC